ncbi:MAG: serine/threonine-protein kinase [Myxococcales bacterium]
MLRKALGAGSLVVGAVLTAGCSGPGVAWGVELVNRLFDPGTVVRLMASAPAQLLIDSSSPARRFGPIAGLALAALGVTALLLSRAPRPPEAPAPPPEPVHPEPIELPPEPAELPAAAPTPSGWLQSSPSVAAQAAQRGRRTHLSMPTPIGPQGAQTTRLQEGSGARVQLPPRYRLEDKIGSGAMGTVYRATDTVLDRRVAIKVVNAELHDFEVRELFLKEARALAALSHPGIVVLHDVGIEAEKPYLVMELLEGMHLRDVLGDLPNLPERDVLGYGAQVADALACVHQHGLVHRDVKPENILRLADGARVKLMDFGIAHVVQSQRAKPTAPSGTPYYMSPEQVTGGRLGPWTDIYGLGATLFALMAGSLPFPQGEPLYHAVHTQAPDPRTFNRALGASTAKLLLRCLAKDPAARPQDAAELAAALRDLASS